MIMQKSLINLWNITLNTIWSVVVFLERVPFLINWSNFINFQNFFKFYFIKDRLKFLVIKTVNKLSNLFIILVGMLLENDIFLMLSFSISLITSVFSISLKDSMLLLLIQLLIIAILVWLSNLAIIDSIFLVSDEEVGKKFS